MPTVDLDESQELDSPTGIAGVQNGGSGANLSATGPGLVYQASAGAPFSVGASPSISLNLEVFNVKAAPYNATGDGVADDTAEVQAAITAANAAGGGVVFFPAGTYLIAGSLTLYDDVTLRGQGMYLTTVRQSTIASILFEVSGTTGVTIEKMTLTQEAGGVYDTTGVPLINNASLTVTNLTVDSVRFRDSNKQGIFVSNSTGTIVRDCRFENIGRGACILNAGTDASVIGCHFEATGDDAVGFTSTFVGGVVTGCVFDSVGSLLDQGAGVKIHDSDVSVSNCVFRNCFNAGVSVKQSNSGSSSPRRVSVTNIVIDGLGTPSSGTPTQAGVEVAELWGAIVIANSIFRTNRTAANLPAIYFSGVDPYAYISISGVTIQENPVLTASSAAIHLKGRFQAADISNCIIRGSSFGVQVQTESATGVVTVRNTKFMPSYSEGTVSIENGSPTVTGTGTAWTNTWNGKPIFINGIPYTITSVDSTTQITLSGNIAESTASGLGYVITNIAATGNAVFVPGSGAGLTHLEVTDCYMTTAAYTNFVQTSSTTTTCVLRGNVINGATLVNGTGNITNLIRQIDDWDVAQTFRAGLKVSAGGTTITAQSGTGGTVLCQTSPTITTPVISGAVSSYNSVTTAGFGLAPIAANVALSAQAASVGTTNLIASAPAGRYRISWQQEITQAATTSSSLLTTLGWNNGAAKTSTLWVDYAAGTTGTTADASNTANSTRGNCIVIDVAASTNITYATTYASSGATAMQYALNIVVERIQ